MIPGLTLKKRPQQKKEIPIPLHFRRIELKYLMPDRLIGSFLRCIAPYMQPDPYLTEEAQGRTSYPVTSLYFDSLDLVSLREKEAGLLSRRKVRLRTYEGEFHHHATGFLEVKRRHDFVVSKDRVAVPLRKVAEAGSPAGILPAVLAEVEQSDVLAEVETLRAYQGLVPTALVRYHRTPFVGMQDHRFRVTIDSHLEGSWKPFHLFGPQPFHAVHPGHSVVEVKFNHALPAWFHDILQEWELQRVSHSKYAMVVTQLKFPADLLTLL